jgi:hypothetical protein
VAGAAIDLVAAGLHDRIAPWLQTREGVASASISVVVFWISWAAAGAPLLTAVLLGTFTIVLVSLSARVWESRTAPDAAEFSRVDVPLDGSVDLQPDPNAGFWRDRRGFLWGNRIWFTGTGCPPRQLRPETYLRLREWREQDDLPVFVARAQQRQWWWWRNAFYWESGDCGPEDVAALLVMLERKDQQGMEWEFDARLAGPIPEDLKRLVFERDRGRCRVCGSEELIQFHHVVPWSLGGRNEAQNLRLVCAGCQRRRVTAGQARATTSLVG